jgi:hypothetical protein
MQHRERPPGGALFARPQTQREVEAQPLGQQARRQGAIPGGRAQPRAGAREQLGGDGARGAADRERVRAEHLLNKIGEARPVFRQGNLRDAEKRRESAEFRVVALAFVGRERRVDQLEGDDRAVGQGGPDPAQRGDIVGAIGCARRKRADAFGEDA